MRFLADGPDLPGDLLDARDEGQVIFFCGAGVSRAEAGGPSFRELADRVVTSLGSSKRSAARQLLDISEQIVPVPGVGGIPPADRIFAMLEQEFPIADVRRAVARALRPKDNPGLGPHRSLLDLSRGPDGVIRMVTTNFDRVFELADPDVKIIVPPVLPDPAHATTFSGIIHLHGKVSSDYERPDSPEFVLSSADFGRAYLADGWATSFMRALMERYRIVFVGYSADDPPIQYLLEALQPSLAPGGLYAFQEGEASIATGLWRHKGVTAIPFKGFASLWQTLEAWAQRAKDPDFWRRGIAAMASRGPRDLTPHERGQVAHLVSSPIGARIFTYQEPVPPAEWLCAFDPYVRYSDPHPRYIMDLERDVFDPFTHYGLDDEIAPDRNKEDRFLTPTIPSGSWSAFEAMAGEPTGSLDAFLPSMRGPTARLPAPLPRRLSHLAVWMGRIAYQPCALWWASGQNALHPDVKFQLRNAAMREDVPPDIKRSWLLLLAALDEAQADIRDRYQLQAEIKAEGWSHLAMIKLAEAERPRLTVTRPLTSPIGESGHPIRMISADVTYPPFDPDLLVPDAFVLDHLDATRRNLVIAARLEEMIGGHGLESLRPLNPFDRDEGEFDPREPELASLMEQLAELVRRQYELAPELAISEVASWRSELGLPFRNLRVWAMAEPRLTDAYQASAIAHSLGEDIWDNDLERDLLTALKARWGDLDDSGRQRIEASILAGPQPWEGISPTDFEPYRIDAVLRRLFWMQRENLPASFDLDGEITRHKKLLPEWTEEAAADRLDRSRARSGWVRTDPTHDMLADVPLDSLLEAAEEASGRSRDFLTQMRPFIGFVDKWPARALAALRHAAKAGKSWSWAWNDLLGSEQRAQDKPRFACHLARCILAMPEAVLVDNLRAVARWFDNHAKPVWDADRLLARRIWDLLCTMVDRHPSAAKSSLVRTRRPDWITMALNSPGGKLVDMLFRELEWSEDPAYWDSDIKDRATRLLGVASGPRVHIVVRLSMRANWLYERDPEWTQEHLVPLLTGGLGEDITEAAMSGLLWQNRRPPDGLYQRLKDRILERLTLADEATAKSQTLVRMVLAGWYARSESDERLIASADLREALIETGELQRAAMLNLVAQWAEAEEEIAVQTETFLQDVWPRQLAARSPRISTALAQLALRAGERLPQITAAILPILESSAEPIETLPLYHRAGDDQIARFPQDHLALLHALLPRDARLWPWGMAQVIERLGEIETLKGDPRLTELRRRQALF